MRGKSKMANVALAATPPRMDVAIGTATVSYARLFVTLRTPKARRIRRWSGQLKIR